MRKIIIKTILKINSATSYSLAGLKTAFLEEFAFRLELLAFIIALPAAIVLGKTALERALLISTLLLVLIVELLNSAVENTLNRIDSSWHPLTKKAKDLGSAAVMLAITNALVVWAFIFFAHY